MPKELSRLEEVELREVWSDEAQDFTPWLAEEENLILLSEALDMELELESQEINVGEFRADILCRDAVDGSRVLIENQLERTDHSHLGQILTYAAGLDIHTVIWIAKEFREEHRAVLDRLNEITDEHFQYFGIEIKVWQIGDSARAPQFEIVSSPNNWSRTVSQDTERAANKDLTEIELQLRKFWEKFIEYLNDRQSSLSRPNPRPFARMHFGIGKMGFSLDPTLLRGERQIRIQLTIKEKNAKAHFYLLRKQRKEIEDNFGESLEWNELPKGKQSKVSLCKRDTDPMDEAEWPNQHEWLALNLEKFYEVFHPRINTLNAADWKSSEY